MINSTLIIYVGESNPQSQEKGDMYQPLSQKRKIF